MTTSKPEEPKSKMVKRSCTACNGGGLDAAGRLCEQCAGSGKVAELEARG